MRNTSGRESRAPFYVDISDFFELNYNAYIYIYMYVFRALKENNSHVRRSVKRKKGKKRKDNIEIFVASCFFLCFPKM